MYFLDDFHLLIAAAQIARLGHSCVTHSQHADIVLVTPVHRAGLLFELRTASQIVFGQIAIPLRLGGRARQFQSLPARTSSLIATPELALSAGNPWASAEMPF
jgi:hypothetical protein